jgi:predicted RND superfamily exporter protein
MGLFFQTQTEYIFGAGGYAGNDSEIALERQEIGEHFNEYETINLLLNNSDKTKELALIDLLEDTENVIEVDALYTAVPPNTPESSIPEEAIQGYNQNGYTRMTIYTDFVEESNAMFEFNETIDSLVDSQYEEYYMLGIISSTYEIRDTVLEDTPIVLLVSALMIGLVLVVVFKNLFVAVLLILVIQTAIWFNVGLLAINGKEVIYIGYLVVLALQLGATIDYAVLFASRYIEARHTVDKGEALGYSLKKSSIPIMISGIILAAAGFAEMLFSKITVVSDIGLLIGRGALLSLGMVLFFLPSIIYITDKWFVRKKIRNKLN